MFRKPYFQVYRKMISCLFKICASLMAMPVSCATFVEADITDIR